MKKTIALFMSLSLLFLFVACHEQPEQDETTTSQNSSISDSVLKDEPETEITDEVVEEDESRTDEFSEKVNIEETDKESLGESPSKMPENTTKNKKPVDKDNPANWNKEQVVAFYKKACMNSSHVTSKQTMHMRKDSLKAAGGLGWLLDIAEPIIRGVMKLNEVSVPGITGGHEKLSVDDCKTAKAYKTDDYVVVEMTMKDQIDGIYGKRDEGHVGHAIFVVDGVAEVAEQFSQFDVRYKEADIKIYYTDAKLKVKINNDGVIEKGTWTYVCTPVVNDLYIEGFEVDGAGAVVDYGVTLNGGF